MVLSSSSLLEAKPPISFLILLPRPPDGTPAAPASRLPNGKSFSNMHEKPTIASAPPPPLSHWIHFSRPEGHKPPLSPLLHSIYADSPVPVVSAQDPKKLSTPSPPFAYSTPSLVSENKSPIRHRDCPSRGLGPGVIGAGVTTRPFVGFLLQSVSTLDPMQRGGRGTHQTTLVSLYWER